MTIKRLASFKTGDDFYRIYKRDNITLPFFRHVSASSSLARPYVLGNKTIGNRFAVLPMEGWDGTLDGHPTDLVRRRWRNFGLSGAKLIWGGEAVAVRHDGRANPHQLLLNEDTLRTFPACENYWYKPIANTTARR